MYDDYQEKEEIQEEILNEPSPTYKKGYTLADRPIPPHIMEDIRISMEQYERGECTDVFEFLEELKRRNH